MQLIFKLLLTSYLNMREERYCNNVNYVKNNAIFEPPSMRACSSTPPKQNKVFVKEHNRTPLIIIITNPLVYYLGYHIQCYGKEPP